MFKLGFSKVNFLFVAMDSRRIITAKRQSQRNYQWTFSGADIISLDDDPKVQKAIMFCGHIISPESMKNYCSAEIKKGNTIIKCPAFGCVTTWPFSLCKSVMKLATTANEELEMDEQMNKNFIFGITNVEPCPVCHCFLEKPKDITSDQVSCPWCEVEGKSHIFCWSCKMPWISYSMKDCGNSNCDRGARKLMILANCPEKLIQKRSTPSIRGCPTCGLLMEYIEYCTQMHCPDCKGYFCFYCLRSAKTKKELSCKPYDSNCYIASRQTTLPNL